MMGLEDKSDLTIANGGQPNVIEFGQILIAQKNPAPGWGRPVCR